MSYMGIWGMQFLNVSLFLKHWRATGESGILMLSVKLLPSILAKLTHLPCQVNLASSAKLTHLPWWKAKNLGRGFEIQSFL